MPSFLLLATAFAERPPGVPIPDAVVVDVTPEGLNAFVPIAQAFIPHSIDVPVFADHHCEEVCIIGCFCLYEYEYGVSNGWASVDINDAVITPVSGQLLLDANITVQLNSQQDPLDVYLQAGAVGIDFDQDCDAWVDPFDIAVHGSIALDLLPNGQVQADLPPLDWDWTLTSDDMTITSCGTIETLTEVLDFIGVDVFQLVLDAVEPEIASAIDGLTDDLDLQSTLQDAIDGATIEEELDLAGVQLTVSVQPADISISSNGIRIALDGLVDAPPDPCTDVYAINGSLETPSLPPNPGEVLPGLAFTPHLQVYADDDLLNQALYSIWRGGLLCQEIDDEALDLPIAINTDLLGLLGGDAYDELFPDTGPMELLLRPTRPPTGGVGTQHDLQVTADGLELDIYAPIDGRMTRQLTLDLAADLGADLNFDGISGALAIDVAFDTESISITARDNEFAPQANDAIVESFSGLIDTIAEPLIGPALDGLAFDLPSFEGIGLQQAVITAAGTSGDRIGVGGTIGQVSYTGPDCGGCDAGSGCDGGSSCDSTAVGGRLFVVSLPLVLALLRRRQTA